MTSPKDIVNPAWTSAEPRVFDGVHWLLRDYQSGDFLALLTDLGDIGGGPGYLLDPEHLAVARYSSADMSLINAADIDSGIQGISAGILPQPYPDFGFSFCKAPAASVAFYARYASAYISDPDASFYIRKVDVSGTPALGARSNTPAENGIVNFFTSGLSNVPWSKPDETWGVNMAMAASADAKYVFVIAHSSDGTVAGDLFAIWDTVNNVTRYGALDALVTYGSGGYSKVDNGVTYTFATTFDAAGHIWIILRDNDSDYRRRLLKLTPSTAGGVITLTVAAQYQLAENQDLVGLWYVPATNDLLLWGNDAGFDGFMTRFSIAGGTEGTPVNIGAFTIFPKGAMQGPWSNSATAAVNGFNGSDLCFVTVDTATGATVKYPIADWDPSQSWVNCGMWYESSKPAIWGSMDQLTGRTPSLVRYDLPPGSGGDGDTCAYADDEDDALQDPITWPECDLVPTRISVKPVSPTVSPGRSFTSLERVLQPDAGSWEIELQDIPINTLADILLWREIESGLNGRANTILVPVYEGKLSGTPIAATANADVAIGAVIVTINKTAGATLQPGMQFSDLLGQLYRIKSVVSVAGNINTVKVWPPVRRPITSADALEFNKPVCRCRLASDDGMNVMLELQTFARPSVRFLEDV